MKRILIVIGIVLLAFGGLYLFLTIRNSNEPPPFALSTTTAGSPGSTSAPSSTVAATTGPQASGFDGEWTIAPGSEVGYRVNEKLANLPVRNDAVGRTSAVTGTLTLERATVTAVEVKADLRELSSDEGNRDRAIRTRGIESDRFPDATFVLLQPISLGSVPDEGQQVSARAAGKLTLHGVTRDVAVDVKGQVTGGQIEVVATLPVSFPDFDIVAPKLGPVAEIDDKGTIEMRLLFARSARP